MNININYLTMKFYAFAYSISAFFNAVGLGS